MAEEKEQKFYILEINHGVHDPRFVEVQGEIVDVGEGFEAFVRNKALPSDITDWWQITDLATGAKLSGVFGTRLEAIQDARKNLAVHGLDEYKQRQETGFELYGRSPAVES